MTAEEVLLAAGEGHLTTDAAVTALVALGMHLDDAKCEVAIATGASQGDVIQTPAPSPSKPSPGQ